MGGDHTLQKGVLRPSGHSFCKNCDRPRPTQISAATYRGAKCPTLKTAEKQPKRVPSGSRQNSRKTAGKTAETPEKHPKTVKTAVFRVFRLFFRLFFGCFTVTHSAPFSAVFRLFSMSGIWHLCRWPQRLQGHVADRR